MFLFHSFCFGNYNPEYIMLMQMLQCYPLPHYIIWNVKAVSVDALEGKSEHHSGNLLEVRRGEEQNFYRNMRRAGSFIYFFGVLNFR